MNKVWNIPSYNFGNNVVRLSFCFVFQADTPHVDQWLKC